MTNGSIESFSILQYSINPLFPDIDVSSLLTRFN